jgi:hypothetical protein
MNIKSKSVRNGLVIALCVAIVVSMVPFQVKADTKDKIIIHIGKPSVWSIGQAHYLLAKMHNRNLYLTTRMPDEDALDPNRANGTRVTTLQTIFDVEAQLNQRIGTQNRLALQDRQDAVNRKKLAQADLGARQGDLEILDQRINHLKKQQVPLQEQEDQRAIERRGKDGKVDTADDELPTEDDKKRQMELAVMQRKLDRLTEERTALVTQVTALQKTASDPVALPQLADPELSTAAISLPGFTNIQALINKAVQSAGKPSMAASIALDNFVQMQYEIIAKQLTLLRDEIGPEERIVFLELPSSIYSVPGKADDYIAQIQWQVTRYYEDKENNWRDRSSDNSGRDKRVEQIDFATLQLKKLKLLIKQEEEKGENRTPESTKQLENLKKQQTQLESLKKQQTQLENLKTQQQQTSNETSAQKKKLEDDIKKLEDDITTATSEIAGLQENSNKEKIVHMWDENDVTFTPAQFMIDALQETSPYHYRWKALDKRTGEKNVDTLKEDLYKIRALDIIPRQSALNINDYHATVSRVNFLGVLKTLIGFGIKVGYQRQRELYEEFLQQEIFAAGFGKGLNTFGWTYGSMPGSKRIAPGVRTSYAVLAVPKDASMLELTATGIAYDRCDSPDYEAYNKVYKSDTKQQVSKEKFYIKIPNEKTERFTIQSAEYTAVKKGQAATVIIKGDYFSPTAGILINGEPLRRSISVSNNATSKSDCFDPTEKKKIDGCYEQVSSREIVANFTMNDNSYIGTPTISLVTPERSSAINYFKLDVNYHQEGRRSLDEMSLTEPVFIDDFSLKDLKELKIRNTTNPVVKPNPDFPNEGKYIFARLVGNGLRRRATVMVNDHLLDFKEPVIELAQHPITFRIQPREVPAMEIAKRLIKNPNTKDEEFAIQESTHAYLLYFKKPEGNEWKIRYYNRTKQSFDAQEHTYKPKSPPPAYKILHYIPKEAPAKTIVDIRFTTLSPLPAPVITINSHDGSPQGPVISEGNGKWRQVFEIEPDKIGTLVIQREKIDVTVIQPGAAQQLDPLEIPLPIEPQVTRIINPRTKRASGYTDEEPVVTILGSNLQNVVSVLFGEVEGKIIGTAHNSSILVKVPKRDAITKGQALQVPVRLKTRDESEVSSAIYYTYFGPPIPMLIYRPGRPYPGRPYNANQANLYDAQAEEGGQEDMQDAPPPPRRMRAKAKATRSKR